MADQNSCEKEKHRDQPLVPHGEHSQHLEPAFKRDYLEQGQEGAQDIVEVGYSPVELFYVSVSIELVVSEGE